MTLYNCGCGGEPSYSEREIRTVSTGPLPKKEKLQTLWAVGCTRCGIETAWHASREAAAREWDRAMSGGVDGVTTELVMPKKDELKPCPFCRNPEIYYEQYERQIGKARWRVICAACRAIMDTGTGQSKGQAAVAWNRRAQE